MPNASSWSCCLRPPPPSRSHPPAAAQSPLPPGLPGAPCQGSQQAGPLASWLPRPALPSWGRLTVFTAARKGKRPPPFPLGVERPRWRDGRLRKSRGAGGSGVQETGPPLTITGAEGQPGGLPGASQRRGGEGMWQLLRSEAAQGERAEMGGGEPCRPLIWRCLAGGAAGVPTDCSLRVRLLSFCAQSPASGEANPGAAHRMCAFGPQIRNKGSPPPKSPTSHTWLLCQPLRARLKGLESQVGDHHQSLRRPRPPPPKKSLGLSSAEKNGQPAGLPLVSDPGRTARLVSRPPSSAGSCGGRLARRGGPRGPNGSSGGQLPARNCGEDG